MPEVKRNAPALRPAESPPAPPALQRAKKHAAGSRTDLRQRPKSPPAFQRPKRHAAGSRTERIAVKPKSEKQRQKPKPVFTC